MPAPHSPRQRLTLLTTILVLLLVTMGPAIGGSPADEAGPPRLDAFEQQYLDEIRYALWLDAATRAGEIPRQEGVDLRRHTLAENARAANGNS